MSFAGFLTVALVHLLAAMSPGPSFILSVRTAASEGFRPAAALAVGFGLGAMAWAAAALLGLTILFDLAPLLFTGLKVAGGAFLLYLAYRMWRHAAEPIPAPAADAPPRRSLDAVRLGILTMFANPKTAVFFGAVFIGLVPATATLPDKFLIANNIFWVESAWYLVVAWLFSMPRARRAYGRFKALLDRVFGSFLGLLGAKIATT